MNNNAPEKRTYRGVHGTCLTLARSVQRIGLRASNEGRAGKGAYLWAYVNDYAEAVALAEDWYRDCLNGNYARCAEPGRVILFFEIDLLPAETAAFDLHIEGLATARRQNGANEAGRSSGAVSAGDQG